VGRYRKPAATTRRRRNHTDRVEREARLDDLARGYHWGTDPGRGGLTKHNGSADNCSSPDADQCTE
jgi:hypothetical protein